MIRYVASAIASCWIASASWASCMIDGRASQGVWLTVEGKHLERWEPVGSEIHRVRLPKGFELGVKIEPATQEKYRELFARHSMRGIDEAVKIDLYDMSDSAAPKLISTTWGGANSKQGFGPRGGANAVPVMGEQVEFWFHKSVCVTPETVGAVR
jgi:hypothetical protein